MKNSQNINIYDFIDKEISELLSINARSRNKKVEISKVIQMLL